jgi:hypothetical protein
MKFSNYPETNLFSPVSVRSILYLANANGIKPAITGKDYFAETEKYPRSESDLTISVTNSAGMKDSLKIPGVNRVINLRDMINSASLYRISNEEEIISEFPANILKSESETKRLTPGELSEYLINSLLKNVNVIGYEQTLSASVTTLRTGKEIWQYFLLLALLFLLAEYFLAKSITNKGKQTK